MFSTRTTTAARMPGLLQARFFAMQQSDNGVDGEVEAT
jgi:hypothetical protein